jgi:hypothetical protein
MEIVSTRYLAIEASQSVKEIRDYCNIWMRLSFAISLYTHKVE